MAERRRRRRSQALIRTCEPISGAWCRCLLNPKLRTKRKPLPLLSRSYHYLSPIFSPALSCFSCAFWFLYEARIEKRVLKITYIHPSLCLCLIVSVFQFCNRPRTMTCFPSSLSSSASLPVCLSVSLCPCLPLSLTLFFLQSYNRRGFTSLGLEFAGFWFLPRTLSLSLSLSLSLCFPSLSLFSIKHTPLSCSILDHPRLWVWPPLPAESYVNLKWPHLLASAWFKKAKYHATLEICKNLGPQDPPLGVCTGCSAPWLSEGVA